MPSLEPRVVPITLMMALMLITNLGTSLKSIRWIWWHSFASDPSIEVLTNCHALFLSLVPVPLVYLALAEAELLRDASDIFSWPVGVLFEFILENLKLFYVLSLTTLDVTVSGISLLCLFEQSTHAFIEVVILKPVLRDIEESREYFVVLGRTSENLRISLVSHIIFFCLGVRSSSFILTNHHGLIL
jgi:hypothetical protein